ncbi:MAG: hypothetical protein OXC91_01835 [Rhodobacteraceae bacterium]|nr:hypothetical protein [Paracoccaceae bacterium]
MKGKGKFGTGHGSGMVKGRCAGSNRTNKDKPVHPVPGKAGMAIGGGKTPSGFKGGRM